MTQAAGIEFINVTKAYGARGESVAVRGISFSVAAGTLTTLLGPSGCGKTTTLRMIAGLEAPTSGKIEIGGRDVTLLPPSERNVSLVFQSYALFPHMRVLDNVAYGLVVSGTPKAAAHKRAEATLASVGMTGLSQRWPSELSGGQQQRVAVARALILEPSVLLFDEPLSNLDARLRRQMREEIRALQQRLRLTVVYVTHDQAEALAVSDTIIVMNQGAIAQMGAPRELYEAPASRFIAGFIGEANLIDGTLDSSGSVEIGPLVIPSPRADLAPGPITLAVRPEAWKIGDPGSGGMPGRVVKAAYLGGYCEYTISVPQGDQFVVSPDIRTLRLAGDAVALTLGNTGIAVIPRE
ncbi:MAG: ABC transporter ATP-binding protein [Betaproteobacteria bacterium]